MKNYYAILEVPVGCSLEEIRQAYRRLAQENLDNDAVFTDLKEAHEVLTTPTRRAEYDLAAWGETFSPGSLGGVEAPPTLDDTSHATPAHSSRCPMGSEAQCPVVQARVASADKFCPDCGFLLASLSAEGGFDLPEQAQTARQIQLEEPEGRTHRLQPGPNLIGRESADILLPDKTVSRQHARLDVGEDSVVMLEDLSSTNGTQVNGETLVPHVPRQVTDGDQLRFGSILTRLSLPPLVPIRAELPPPGEAAPTTEDEHGSPPGAKVVEMREDDAREYFLVPGVTTFGRRGENSVVLLGDPYVSGNHAQIIADENTFRLTDVGSTNGTLINGERLAINAPVLLSDGDVILIGGTALRFELISSAAETETPEGAAPVEPPERIAEEYDAPEPVEEPTDAETHADADMHAEG